MFQSLRPNDTIYILDKADVPSLRTGQVVNVSAPTPVYNTQTIGVTMGMQTTKEVLVRAKVDEKEGDFAHLPAEGTVKDYGNMIVTDSREAMLSEVDKIRMNAQNELNREELNKSTVSACDEMFKTLNPNYAKELERDQAIDNLNSRLNGIENSMSQILKLLNKK